MLLVLVSESHLGLSRSARLHGLFGSAGRDSGRPQARSSASPSPAMKYLEASSVPTPRHRWLTHLNCMVRQHPWDMRTSLATASKRLSSLEASRLWVSAEARTYHLYLANEFRDLLLELCSRTTIPALRATPVFCSSLMDCYLWVVTMH